MAQFGRPRSEILGRTDHDLLHRLIDRDAVLSRNRTRRTASHLALARLRQKLQPDSGSAA